MPTASRHASRTNRLVEAKASALFFVAQAPIARTSSTGSRWSEALGGRRHLSLKLCPSAGQRTSTRHDSFMHAPISMKVVMTSSRCAFLPPTGTVGRPDAQGRHRSAAGLPLLTNVGAFNYGALRILLFRSLSRDVDPVQRSVRQRCHRRDTHLTRCRRPLDHLCAGEGCPELVRARRDSPGWSFGFGFLGSLGLPRLDERLASGARSASWTVGKARKRLVCVQRRHPARQPAVSVYEKCGLPKPASRPPLQAPKMNRTLHAVSGVPARPMAVGSTSRHTLMSFDNVNPKAGRLQRRARVLWCP